MAPATLGVCQDTATSRAAGRGTACGQRAWSEGADASKAVAVPSSELQRGKGSAGCAGWNTRGTFSESLLRRVLWLLTQRTF